MVPSDCSCSGRVTERRCRGSRFTASASRRRGDRVHAPWSTSTFCKSTVNSAPYTTPDPLTSSSTADDRDRIFRLVESRRLSGVLRPATTILVAGEQIEVIGGSRLSLVQTRAETHATKLRQNVAIVQPLSACPFTEPPNHNRLARRKLAGQTLSTFGPEVLMSAIRFPVRAEDTDCRRTDRPPFAARLHTCGDHSDEIPATWRKIGIDEDDVRRNPKHAADRVRDGLRPSGHRPAMRRRPPRSRLVQLVGNQHPGISRRIVSCEDRMERNFLIERVLHPRPFGIPNGASALHHR